MADPKKAAKAAETIIDETLKAGETLKPQIPPFPQFDQLSRAEVPAAYREIAEKGLAQAKQNYERVKAATQESSELIESTYATAVKGAAEYNLKLLEALRANVNAHFDFVGSLLSVKSPSEAVELSSAHARKTFEQVSAQGKELASLAQKVSTDTAEPIKAGMNKALRVVA